MCVYTQAFVCVCLCLYELWVCAFTLILDCFLLVVGGCSSALCLKHSMKYAALVITGMTAGVSAFAPAGASISLRSPCTVRTHQRKQICKCTYNQMLSPSTKCSLSRPNALSLSLALSSPASARSLTHCHFLALLRSLLLSLSLSHLSSHYLYSLIYQLLT